MKTKPISVKSVKVGDNIAPDFGKVTSISKVERTTKDVIDGKPQDTRTDNFIVLSFEHGPDRWHFSTDSVWIKLAEDEPKKPAKKKTSTRAGQGEFSKARRER